MRKLPLCAFAFVCVLPAGATQCQWIRNVSATPGGSNAVVTWSTCAASTSQVKYGLTTAYSNITPADSTLVTKHQVLIAGLKSNTLYHYQVLSTDANGTRIASKDHTFKTTAVTLSSISLSPQSATVLVGGTQQFRATGTYSDGTTADLTSLCSWSSSNAALASVNAAGLATGIAAGNVNIIGSYSGMAGQSTLQINAAVTHSVSLTWKASTTAGVTYDVLRSSVSGGPYTQIASSITATQYTDSKVTSGHTYYYVAAAQDSYGMSTYSNQATAVVP